ncbi:MAG: NifU N-terminal domain-containing protein [Deltaproteobacteria bacterium]|nr:NifU N-terminal domain-containing protein [Deltaproteobacteria bacterium]
MSKLVLRPEPLPEPNGFQFYVNRQLSDTPKMFLNVEQSLDNPLAKALLEDGKIKSVFLNEQILKVNKIPEASWDEVFEIVENAVYLIFPE